MVRAVGYPLEKLRSKIWDEFARPDAPHMDFIITVCDNAAGEMCPVWPGKPVTAHWGFPDPSGTIGTDQEKRDAFARIFRAIRADIGRLVELPLETLDRAALVRELHRIHAS